MGAWSLKSKGRQRESGKYERGGAPSLFPRRYSGFSLRLALLTVVEVSRALQLHWKGGHHRRNVA